MTNGLQGGFLIPPEAYEEIAKFGIQDFWIVGTKPRKWWQVWKRRRILDIRLYSSKEK